MLHAVVSALPSPALLQVPVRQTTAGSVAVSLPTPVPSILPRLGMVVVVMSPTAPPLLGRCTACGAVAAAASLVPAAASLVLLRVVLRVVASLLSCAPRPFCPFQPGMIEQLW